MHRWLVLILVAAAYAVSFLLPAAKGVAMSDGPLSGAQAFMQALLLGGWLGWILWSANLALWISGGLYASRKLGGAAASGLIGMAIASLTPVLLGLERQELLVGFWLWMACPTALGLAAGIEQLVGLRKEHQVPTSVSD